MGNMPVMVTIASRDELEDWLQDKPKDWAQIIAARAALRALPFLGRADSDWLTRFGLLTFRANAISWAARNFPAHDMAYAAAGAAYAAADAAYAAAYAAVYAAYAATDAAGAAAYAADAAAYAAAGAAYAAFWQAVSSDCEWLSKQDHGDGAARVMTRRSLWLAQPPNGWNADWQKLAAKLREIDPNYTVWTEWYERRIRGERAAFAIPGDNGRVEDKKILIALADATDKDFWGKGQEYVNATLKNWIDEARARVAPLPEILGAISPDPQDTRSPQFGSDLAGRIAIKRDAGADQLRSDPQSLARHARAIEMARKLGEALRNHNNAGYMSGMASDYVAAMGGGEESPDPSALVFAGDQLREAIAKHRAAGKKDDLQPLPASADRAASAYLSAHNMYVGSDPFLDDLDRTTRGPDAPLPTANPDEIKHIAAEAQQNDILAEQTHDYIVAASDAAPATYDPSDRHSRFAAGLAQNFARYGIELIWAYPKELASVGLLASVAAATAAFGPVAAAGGAVTGITVAYYMARNMIANEAFYKTLLTTSRAGEYNFNRLMRFLKKLPYKSLKDE